MRSNANEEQTNRQLNKKNNWYPIILSIKKFGKASRCQQKLHHDAIELEASSSESIQADQCTSTCHDKELADVVDNENLSTSVPPLATTSYLSGTIFSPPLEAKECQWQALIYSCSVEDSENLAVPDLVSDDSDDRSNSSFDEKICNSESSHVTDAITACLSVDGDVELDPLSFSSGSDYEYVPPGTMFDASERPLILPFLEEVADINSINDAEFIEAATLNPDDDCLFFAIHQAISSQCHVGNYEDLGDADYFDPQLFIANFPDIPDPFPSYLPILSPRSTQKRKSVTLVLDLDETLVHSSLEHCLDADFTFPVYFNMKEHTVYVRKRPHLHTFLERVAEMFEIIIFTASHSIYAEKLLNILDPDQKIISERMYRESCVFTDGSYVKDLTVLGRDLAKVAIIDNTPQVFQLQVNNGIPIQSWFDDPTDSALLSILPFLETTLASAADVRPIIAKQFGIQD